MMLGNSKAMIAGVLLVGAISLGGCATKKFVRTEVGVVNTKAEETQGRVTSNEGKLGQHDTRLADLDRTSREALERAMAAGKLAEGKFEYQMVVSDDTTKFKLDKFDLSPEAQAKLVELANHLKQDNKNVYLEIQGHTDATGSTAYNQTLGKERADAVRLFLNKQGVALNRMATISYGETIPATDNKTRDGRAQNRRVVVVVLS